MEKAIRDVCNAYVAARQIVLRRAQDWRDAVDRYGPGTPEERRAASMNTQAWAHAEGLMQAIAVLANAMGREVRWGDDERAPELV